MTYDDGLNRSLRADRITHVTLKDCLNSVPYMCFYVKRNLEYGSAPAPLNLPAGMKVEAPDPPVPAAPVAPLISNPLPDLSADPSADASTPSSDASTTSEH